MEAVIIEIKDDGNGAWNLVAKNGKDDPPLYVVRGRSPWAIKALVHGILNDFDEPIEAEARSDAEVPDAVA